LTRGLVRARDSIPGKIVWRSVHQSPVIESLIACQITRDKRWAAADPLFIPGEMKESESIACLTYANRPVPHIKHQPTYAAGIIRGSQTQLARHCHHHMTSPSTIREMIPCCACIRPWYRSRLDYDNVHIEAATSSPQNLHYGVPYERRENCSSQSRHGACTLR
jgi:hypothetical protein